MVVIGLLLISMQQLRNIPLDETFRFVGQSDRRPCRYTSHGYTHHTILLSLFAILTMLAAIGLLEASQPRHD